MSEISLQDLKEEKAFLERKLAAVDLMIFAYSGGKAIDFDSPIQFESSISELKEVPHDDFPFHKKWIEQLLYLLNKKDRFLSNHELAESLLSYYPQYNIDRLKRKVSVNISAAYKKQSVEGLIKVKVTNLPKGNVWGYTKWIDKKGGIISKHKPFESKETGQMTIY